MSPELSSGRRAQESFPKKDLQSIETVRKTREGVPSSRKMHIKPALKTRPFHKRGLQNPRSAKPKYLTHFSLYLSRPISHAFIKGFSKRPPFTYWLFLKQFR